MFMGRKCLQKRNKLFYFYNTFMQLIFNFCMDCAYLSDNRVNGVGENSNLSSQLRAVLHCASTIIYRFACIQYHVFISCGKGNTAAEMNN